ncbi:MULTISPECIES: hypothetical protein [Clostridium]|uniref:hypothetical protein n=1 Tax=Clostridium TaxID=1485 RepID=UPI000826FF34|nr:MULTISPECIES: hypothetical protein [Clostridium]PJI08760.1 hypothetical protein CUB90_13175 [Clostridium sp. CT7]
MKKFFSYICVFLLVFTMVGCKKNKKLQNINEFKINSAIKTVEAYMNSYMSNDTSAMNRMYSKGLKKKAQSVNTHYLKVSSYKVINTREMGTTADIEVNVVSADEHSPYTSVDDYTFKIKKDKGKYVIDKIDSSLDKEVFQYKRNLMVKIKDEAKSNILINLRGIPEYAFSKKDDLKVDKLRVSKDTFSYLTLSNFGDTVIISTAGPNPFVGICQITDLEEQESGGQNGSQNQSDQSLEDESQPFKVAAKSLSPVDVYKDSQIVNMIFSKSDDMVAVQYNQNATMHIQVYDAGAGKVLSKSIDKKFPQDKFDLKLVRFDDKYLIFESAAKDNYKDDAEVKKNVGKWEWNLKSYKITKYKD